MIQRAVETVQMMNSDDEIALRRYMNNLENSGAACILLGFWGAMKLFIEIFMDKKNYNEVVFQVDNSKYSEIFLRVVIFVTVVIITLILMSVHLSIGVRAIRYSKGKKKRRSYLFLTALVLICNIWGLANNFHDDSTGQYVLKSTAIAATLVDLTYEFILFDIIRSSVMIAKLRKKGVSDGLLDNNSR